MKNDVYEQLRRMFIIYEVKKARFIHPSCEFEFYMYLKRKCSMLLGAKQ